MSKNRIATYLIGMGLVFLVANVCQASLYKITGQGVATEIASTYYHAIAGHATWGNCFYASRENAVDYYQNDVLHSTISPGKTYYNLGVMGTHGGQFWGVYDGGIDRVLTSGEVIPIATGSYNAVAGSVWPDVALAARSTGGIDVVEYTGGIRTANALPDITFVDLSGNSAYPDWFFGVSDDGGLYRIRVLSFGRTDFEYKLVATNGYTAVAADSRWPDLAFALRDGAIDRINVVSDEVTTWMTGDFVGLGRYSPGPLSAGIFYATVPEPGTLSLLGFGLVGMLFRRRRNKGLDSA